MTKRRPGNPKLAVGYLRRSIGRGRQVLSPRAQRDAISAWARAHGVKVVCWRLDPNAHGTDDIEQRPRLTRALSDLRRLGAGLLIVARRDRLARDIAVATGITRAVHGAGADIVSADGVGNGESDEAAFMRDISDVVSAQERRIIARRIKDALAVKKGRGERLGCIPYGYQVGPDGKHLEPSTAEQSVIARARALSLRAEGRTVRAIAAQLQADGIVGRTGKPLSHTQVHRLLK